MQAERGQLCRGHHRGTTTVRFHDGLGNGQAQACPFGPGLVARLFDAEKPVKEAWQIGRRYLRAGVLHTQRNSPVIVGDGHLYLGVWRRVTDRVGQQVADGAANHQAVTDDERIAVGVETDQFLFGKRLVEIEQIEHLVAQ
jgi:hypothetical protein